MGDDALQLRYVDEDGDLISLVHDADVHECLQAFASSGTCRIHLSVTAAANIPAEEKAADKEDDAAAAPATSSTLQALRTLADSLGLQDLPDEWLEKHAEMLTRAAPFAKQFLNRGAGTPAAPCDMFKHVFQQGQSCSGGQPAQEDAVHWGVTCDISGMSPIRGVRFHRRGSDYDLCETEFLKLSPAEQASFDRIPTPTSRPRMPRGFSPCGARSMFGMLGKMFNGHCNQREQTPRGDELPAAPLSFGSSGPGVEQLQRAFISLGHLDAEAIRWRAGVFGPRTHAAVKALQGKL